MVHHRLGQPLFAPVNAVGRVAILHHEGLAGSVGVTGEGGVHLADNGARGDNVALGRTAAQNVVIPQQGIGGGLAVDDHL